MPPGQEHKDSEATSSTVLCRVLNMICKLKLPASFVVHHSMRCWSIEKHLGASLHVARGKSQTVQTSRAGIPGVQKLARKQTSHAYILEFQILDPRAANTTVPTTPTHLSICYRLTRQSCSLYICIYGHTSILV